jgi:hypothetical protein
MSAHSSSGIDRRQCELAIGVWEDDGGAPARDSMDPDVRHIMVFPDQPDRTTPEPSTIGQVAASMRRGTLPAS